mmetsp:Transcript_21946/g.32861  ORF Transcript_21946/g.32861 Transcript_21946/m.32861 type:complete len:455 (+) Transcript_21946:156-1520(+)
MKTERTNLTGFDSQPQPRDHETVEKSTIKSTSGLYHFEPEPVVILTSALRNNPMSGITFFRFLRLLFVKKYSIDWWRYAHRLLALLLMSIFNTFLSLMEAIYVHVILRSNPRTRRLIEQANNDSQAPVFIIGHPRTGTTLLHSLLALDEERFSFCDTFMAGFPHCFLSFERIGKFLFSGILSETRPMDNMKLHFDLPQEDELAVNLLSGFLVSPYSSISFMRDEKTYRKYQCFRDHDTSAQDVAKWCKWFLFLLNKIKVRDLLIKSSASLSSSSSSVYAPRRVLLKSPCHTGRARLLLKLFPDAKFVFIHRNPYEVFLSGAHMASTTYGYWFLQQPHDEGLQEYILSQGEILHNEYFSCWDDGILHEKNCAEISFEALTKDPMGSINKIYTQLGFSAFEKESNSSYPTHLAEECEMLRGYQRNRYESTILDTQLKNTIRKRWSNQFDRFGYEDK